MCTTFLDPRFKNSFTGIDPADFLNKCKRFLSADNEASNNNDQSVRSPPAKKSPNVSGLLGEFECFLETESGNFSTFLKV